MSENNQVLVVDDEDQIRKLLSIGLGRAGYKVRTAADGTEVNRRRFLGHLADGNHAGRTGLATAI